MLNNSRDKTSFLIATNIIGICAITFFHPFVKQSKTPLTEWLYLASLPIAGAAFCYGIYAIVATQRARNGGPLWVIALAWLLAISNLASPYLERRATPVAPLASPAAAPVSEIDEFLKDAPAYNPGLKAPTEPAHVRYLTDEEVGFAPSNR